MLKSKDELINSFIEQVKDELEMCGQNPHIYPNLCSIKSMEGGEDKVIDMAINMLISEGRRGNIMNATTILGQLESSYTN